MSTEDYPKELRDYAGPDLAARIREAKRVIGHWAETGEIPRALGHDPPKWTEAQANNGR